MPASTKNNDFVDNSPSSSAPVEYSFSPDFRLIYTNYVQAAYTPIDVSLLIGEVINVDNGKFHVQQKIRLTMAAMEAKIVLAILTNTVKNYETQFGEIKIPEGMMQKENL